MNEKNFQLSHWKNRFGEEYTDRNIFSPKELDNLYIQRYGCARTTMNEEFLKGLPKSSRILEVGTNVGNQLLSLKKAGFKNLYGIEPQAYAVRMAKLRDSVFHIVEGSVFDLPFEDSYFDLVFTSGVLIHIVPDKLGSAMKEIVRCSKCLIWGFEYYAEDCQTINYRGNKNLLWKNDFCGAYQKAIPGLKVLRRKKFSYLEDSKMVDEMFLLEK